DLALSCSGRTEEQESAERPLGIADPQVRHHDGPDHGVDRPILADDFLSELVTQLLSLQHGSASKVFSPRSSTSSSRVRVILAPASERAPPLQESMLALLSFCNAQAEARHVERLESASRPPEKWKPD